MNKELSRKEARESAIKYSEEHQTDPSVILAIAGATNTDINYDVFEKGDLRMCSLFDEIKTEGWTEGRAEEIIETGYEFSMSNDDILVRLQSKLNISLQKAQEYFNMFQKQTGRY